MKLLAHVAAVMPSRYGLLALYLLAAIFAYVSCPEAATPMIFIYLFIYFN
jgi:hypothetical protein